MTVLQQQLGTLILSLYKRFIRREYEHALVSSGSGEVFTLFSFLKIFIVAVENVIQARSWENTYRYSLEVVSTAPGASSSSAGAVGSGAASSSRARSSSDV